MLDFMCETGGNDIWIPVSVDSYWLKVVTRPPRLPKDNTWLVPHGCFYLIGRGRCPFCLAIPLSGQLLWGSCGIRHNDFLGKAQVLPTVEAVKELCPQRMHSCFELV